MQQLAVCRASALPPEDYWDSVFPRTPMPNALKQLLYQPEPGKKDHSIPWIQDSLNSNIDEGNSVFKVGAYNYIIDPSKERSAKVDGDGVPSKQFRVGAYNYISNPSLKKSVNVDGDEEPNKQFRVGAYNYKMDPSKKFNSATVDGHDVASEQFRGNENSLHGNAAMNETMYFFQEDLHPGNMVKLPILTKEKDSATFLTQQVADSIPFSTEKFPEILNYFSFESESIEAKSMEQTIKGCEREVMQGEHMFCATSFESFVGSSVSMLGENIQLLANELEKEPNEPVFTIGRGIQNMGEEELVCHKMQYPYAVFLCHSIDRTVVYKVPLVGTDGTKAKALAICHKDTSAWSPNHPAFQILNIKPGTVPICHFVIRDTLIWVRK
ncbi:BURP domain protein RD22-like [Hibiscus syriacus]|uniref:BURP domain protein RD22-like n=1 Tax=Hibiscus syriacus TaxID=106335 RepID=UPI001925135D|nr:BURP domain protein RD22-like [Hibiscus syriacus]